MARKILAFLGSNLIAVTAKRELENVRTYNLTKLV